jgi:nucleoside-diphosphate-sugar epimerase
LRRLLVTGATGFLGSEVVDLARDQGWQVRGLSRRPSMQQGVEAIAGDIADLESLRKASAGADAIIHAAGRAHVFGAAARDSAAFDEVNETGTRNVIEAALSCRVPHVVLVSSVSVYGSYAGVTCNETAVCQPEGPYAVSKWRAELRAVERMKSSETSLTILRFSTIYGAGDRGNVAKLIRVLDRGRFVWLGSGNNRKSLIHKRDAARACLLPLLHPRSGIEVYNVSACAPSMREIVILMCQALGRSIPRFKIPANLIRSAGVIAGTLGDPGGLQRQLKKFMHEDSYDGSMFEKSFGFSPEVSLADGLREEVMHLQNQDRRTDQARS